VTSYDTLAGAFPFSQARWDAANGQLETLSLGLDQLTWSDTAVGAPTIVFVAQSDWGDTGSTLYFDNFRIIDTGATATPAPDLKITTVQFDAKTSTITLKWDSVAGKTYAVDYTQNLGSWPTVLAPSVQGTQTSTTYTGTVPAGTRGFLRVRPTN
jgi:hypothetical protein